MCPNWVKFHLVVRLPRHVSPTAGVSFHYVLRSDQFFTVDDTEGLEQPSTETQDPADVADADAFEELTGMVDLSSAIPVDHLAGDSSAGDPEGHGPLSNQTGAGTFDTGPTAVVDPFPSNAAGAPIPGIPQGSSTYESHGAALSGSNWAPFQSKRDWEFAQWAKSCGATSTAVSKLLAIPDVCPNVVHDIHVTKSEVKLVDTLGLSYNTVNKLNAIIDSELPGQAPFQRKELIIGDERLDLYSRDVLECIRSLYGNPQFAQDLIFAPERHYTSQDRCSRIYNEMHTGDWWWNVQVHTLL
jgi:hypothetical protein